MYKILLFSFLFFGCFSIKAQRIDAENIYNHIEYLASDYLQGRATSSQEEIKAARYIAKKFKASKHILGIYNTWLAESF